MQSAVAETGLAITNPLVLYRALVATKKIEPDPAQHRLALHLQTLYHRLKDYEPAVEYRHRLDEVARTLGRSSPAAPQDLVDTPNEGPLRGIFNAFRERREQADSLALTRRLTSHEAALQLDSPQGLLLYGEVGTGKSMLVDLLADCLPNRKKRRYHFNAFMLDTLARIEQQRVLWSRVGAGGSPEPEYSLLSIARDMVSTSPILFLDEFQLPDRASSKIMSNLFTSFFQLGGVLIATSNRMPEELSKAAGIEFTPPAASTNVVGLRALGNFWRNPGREHPNKGAFSTQSDFTQFLEVLKARCETWNIESRTDFRRKGTARSLRSARAQTPSDRSVNAPAGTAVGKDATDLQQGGEALASDEAIGDNEGQLPTHFHRTASDVLSKDSLDADSVWQVSILQATGTAAKSIAEVPWKSQSLCIYNRKVPVPRTFNGTCWWTFDKLCNAYLGPADYITLASTYHTVILTDVPVLTTLQKNEARRLITLLDALYEARCKLLIRADAGPDELFFPERRGGGTESTGYSQDQGDSVYAETFSEIYQDQTNPFRPNVSAYTSDVVDEAVSAGQSRDMRQMSAYRNVSSILADEDADFGPVYGAGRSAGMSRFDPSNLEREAAHSFNGVDFQKSGRFTGEDERFAYKRAESRLWELCSQEWWERASQPGWWKPLDRRSRSWEDAKGPHAAGLAARTDSHMEGTDDAKADSTSQHRASSFRIHQDPPPKIPWTHAWGMMTWGRKAGNWGRGAEGAEERLEAKRREKEMLEKIQTKAPGQAALEARDRRQPGDTEKKQEP